MKNKYGVVPKYLTPKYIGQMYTFLYCALLFFALTPGILVTLPKGGSKVTVAATHALIFAAVCYLTRRFVVERFQDGDEEEEGEEEGEIEGFADTEKTVKTVVDTKKVETVVRKALEASKKADVASKEAEVASKKAEVASKKAEVASKKAEVASKKFRVEASKGVRGEAIQKPIFSENIKKPLSSMFYSD